jgi:polyhydroxyalkanoate synthase subunit PhaC
MVEREDPMSDATDVEPKRNPRPKPSQAPLRARPAPKIRFIPRMDPLRPPPVLPMQPAAPPAPPVSRVEPAKEVAAPAPAPVPAAAPPPRARPKAAPKPVLAKPAPPPAAKPAPPPAKPQPAAKPAPAPAAAQVKPAAAPKPATNSKAAPAPATVARPAAAAAADFAEPSRRADPVELSHRLARVTERAQRVFAEYLKNRKADDGYEVSDPKVVAAAFQRLGERMLKDPVRLLDAQLALWRDHIALFQRASKRAHGEEVEPLIRPMEGDKRFSDRVWDESFAYSYIKQAYLLTARWVQAMVRDTDGLDSDTRRKVDFYTRQLVDAFAPSNFVATNPKVLRETLDTGGENLVRGLTHFVEDLERGKGKLMLRMTDDKAFRLGENIATTPGKVIFQNDLMQLIQYSPTTEQTYKTPLLIIPPWINKFYILDLKPANSFIRWAVAQGLTVFVISWVNPDRKLALKSFADYMEQGPLTALDAIKEATGERRINVIGYCIGGTLLACLLAWMAKKRDDRFLSATFFTALTDFKEAGELKVFIDDEQLTLLEDHLEHKGYLEGRHMANVFNMMRDNDLIWSFVVNNYLMGRDPMAFDLLYWNSDCTRMPAAMHTFYLRNMYLENRLIQPRGIQIMGEALDLRDVKLPVYQLSTETDHIAPWRSTYTPSQLYAGPYRFVLSGSGHIAGVVNPPAAKKYCYWTNPNNPPVPEDWLASAERHDGSWWPDWLEWIKPHAGKLIPARKPGDGKLKPVEDAPGSYVKVRATD